MKQGGGDSMRRNDLEAKLKLPTSHHVSFYSEVCCMRGERSQSEREVRVPHVKRRQLARATLAFG
eukprot:6185897-Pleurochrysis_carterae.AAC.1